MPLLKKSIDVLKYMARWFKASHNDCVHYRNTVNDNADIAIYCIHGTGDQNSAFSFVVEKIESELNPRIKSIHLLSFEGRYKFKDIVYFANQLKRKIIANKHKKIILMGHSRGALVASYFTEYYAHLYHISVIATINICGPFRGTKWALFPFTFSESIKQMRVNSPFLQELTDKMKQSSNTYFYFSAEKDLLVPSPQAYLEHHAGNHIELNDVDHLTIMLSPQLADHIKFIVHSVL